MTTNIEEYLNMKNESKEQTRKIENQWKIDEAGYDSKQKQLQNERRAIEALEREVYNQKDSAYREKNEKIKEGEQRVSDKLYSLNKEITLCSLKHCLPNIGEFEKTRGWNHHGSIEEDILYDSPLVRIYAIYNLSNKPVNKIDYAIGIFAHSKFHSVINSLLGIAVEFNRYHPEDDVILTSKSFKTLEDAERYNERNNEKFIQDYIPRIEEFNALVQGASDTLKSVFDFRLIEGNSDRLDESKEYLKGYYARSANYEIISKEKDKMVLSRDGEPINIILRDWDFEIINAPLDAIELRNILGTLIYSHFNLPHLYNKMGNIFEEADKLERARQRQEWIAELSEKSESELEDYLNHSTNAGEIKKEIEEYRTANYLSK